MAIDKPNRAGYLLPPPLGPALRWLPIRSSCWRGASKLCSHHHPHPHATFKEKPPLLSYFENHYELRELLPKGPPPPTTDL